MLDSSLIKKERKAPKKPRSKTLKKAAKPKKEPSFFDSFNHVAPLSWIPAYYQDQMKAAKPVRLYKPKIKKKKIPLQ